MAKQVGTSNKGRKLIPLTRAEIMYAQENTNSNMEAARFLNVSYARYRKYAMIYGLFEGHANPTGIGTPKGFGARAHSIKLKDIFANKHPGYNLVRLKNRMIARKLIAEECAMCQFSDKRITDGKSPLLLTFKNRIKDYSQDNLMLLCYNCLFLTTGAPTVAHKGYIEKSFKEPEKIPKNWQVTPRPKDAKELGADEPENINMGFDDIRDEILRELGRD
jgi:hypothetical protein